MITIGANVSSLAFKTCEVAFKNSDIFPSVSALVQSSNLDALGVIVHGN